jgi:hypothetical protein
MNAWDAFSIIRKTIFSKHLDGHEELFLGRIAQTILGTANIQLVFSLLAEQREHLFFLG